MTHAYRLAQTDTIPLSMNQTDLIDDRHSAEFSVAADTKAQPQPKWFMVAVGSGVVAALILLLSSQNLYKWAFGLSYQTVPPVAPLHIVEPEPDTAALEENAAEPIATPVPIYYPPLATEPQFIEFQTGERLNVLLLGSDRRPDEQDFPRTDSLMLLSWERETNTVDLLSLPRDLWVPVPGQAPTKLNLVYSIGEHAEWGGGVPLLIDTIEALTNQPIHHYLWLNFDGFVQVVDQIGGLPIYVPWHVLDERYPTVDYGFEVFELEAGYHVLDGATALKYARTRTQDGDFNRIGRQQDVVRAFIQQVANPANSARLLQAAPNILRTLRYSVQSDLSIPEFLQLAQQVIDVPQMGATLVVDSHLGIESYSDEGMWVLMPDRPQLRAAFQEFFQVSEVMLP